MKSELSNLSFNKSSGAKEILETLFKKAFELGASDIHIDPEEDLIGLRFRIDGTLYRLPNLTLEKHPEIISRIKIISGLRIDEHSRAQDGRFKFVLSPEKFVDVRVSILPSYHGESAVLRILSNKSESLELGNLGFSEGSLDKIEDSIFRSSGMILITGPTGSGKTTTLYAILKALNDEKTSIVTIEEPVEYSIPGIRQIQVNYQSQLTFANGLRSILRQDPNIIMVGEIRDKETASIAVNTALTGHLLLSTLHTNDASATLPRLMEMGIEPFLLASTFNIAVNQRLVKKICEKCKTEIKLKEEDKRQILELFGEKFSCSNIFKGQGCESCHGSGYSGRTVIAEVLKIDEEIRKLILEKRSARDIFDSAVNRGMVTLLTDGLEKVENGVTTLEEVIRVSYE